MTLIEVTAEGVYLTTDNREELLDVSAFIIKNYDRMQSRGQKAVTIYETREAPAVQSAGKGGGS